MRSDHFVRRIGIVKNVNVYEWNSKDDSVIGLKTRQLIKRKEAKRGGFGSGADGFVLDARCAWPLAVGS